MFCWLVLDCIRMTEDRTETLVDRLRGIYSMPIAPCFAPNEGEETFTRTFPVLGEVMERAASCIERLQEGRVVDHDVIEELIAELMIPVDPYNTGTAYVMPIRKEAAERIDTLWLETYPR